MQEGSNQRELKLIVADREVREGSVKNDLRNKCVGEKMQQELLERELQKEFGERKPHTGSKVKILDYTHKNSCKESYKDSEILAVIRSKYLKRAKKISARLNYKQKKEKIEKSKIIVSRLYFCQIYNSLLTFTLQLQQCLKRKTKATMSTSAGRGMQEGSSQNEMKLGMMEQEVTKEYVKQEVEDELIAGKTQQEVMEGELERESVNRELPGGSNRKIVDKKQDKNGGSGRKTEYTGRSSCSEHSEILAVIRSKYLKQAKKMSARLNQEQKKEKIEQSKIIVGYL